MIQRREENPQEKDNGQKKTKDKPNDGSQKDSGEVG